MWKLKAGLDLTMLAYYTYFLNILAYYTMLAYYAYSTKGPIVANQLTSLKLHTETVTNNYRLNNNTNKTKKRLSFAR